MLLTDFPQLTLEQIKVGDKVKDCQLEDIYDTYILIGNPQGFTDDKGFYTIEGNIVFIGTEQNAEYFKAYKANTVDNKCPAVFIQNRDEFTEGIYYE